VSVTVTPGMPISPGSRMPLLLLSTYTDPDRLEVASGVTVTAERLLFRSGSNCSADTWIWLVVGCSAVTRKTTPSWAVAPAGIVPTVQTPVVGSKLPWLIDCTATKSRPAGKGSVATTLVASSGPRLLMTYV